ncbi:peptide deformylase [Pseudenhygromyxa sp. WMMC2535]|uniref:peptide deformylase n=1 Tax=Pseudenhygromyxa sp. WMMC2535 TaxID=2712867 RepID=UPI0015573A18|nr:peptide deformylase [Pseudenhygromyxa sp. WMMC2535]NVB37323.1 peptide deformylase [Pseudenhygromyxa sp. WMMC2535]
MATIRAIAQIGEPVLRQVAREVEPDELNTPGIQGFIDDLIATMRHANGAGLAANQVFEPLQICALEVDQNPRYPYKPKIPLTILVNPKLEAIGDETFVNYEGCLSVPNLRGEVRRHARLRVRALDRHGQPLDFEAQGVSAGTYQHEVDHLFGKLFVDRVEEPTSLCTWESFRRHREAEFRARVEALVARFGS